MKKLRIIANPIAGKGVAAQLLNSKFRSLLDRNFEYDIIQTEYTGHAAELSRQSAPLYDIIAAAGGDGTVNEVASGLKGTSCALGIIPAGSGNGLAKHLKIPCNIPGALQFLTESNVSTVDSLTINGRFAMNVSGFGFDGYVAWLFNKSGKRGLSNYTRIAIQEYMRYSPVDFEIFPDNSSSLKITGHMLVFANASQFGNSAIISPRSQLSDGKLEVVAVTRPPLLSVPSLFFRLFTGRLKDNSHIRTTRCSKVLVTASRPVHLHIDGEASEPVTEVKIEVVPASIRILQKG